MAEMESVNARTENYHDHYSRNESTPQLVRILATQKVSFLTLIVSSVALRHGKNALGGSRKHSVVFC